MKYPELFEYLTDFHDIPESLWKQSGVEVKKVVLKKGEFLIQPGQAANKGAYVRTGLCRSYYKNDKGKEFTKFFQGPGFFAIPLTEVILKIPTRTYTQAVVDSELLVLQHEDFHSLFDKDEDTQALGRKIVEHFFVKKDQKEFELLQLNAEERYEAFIERHKDFIERIPKHHIASYIGITPVALSRIISRRKKQSP